MASSSNKSRIARDYRNMVDEVSDQNRTYPIRHGAYGVRWENLPASWTVSMASEEYEERLKLRERKDA